MGCAMFVENLFVLNAVVLSISVMVMKSDYVEVVMKTRFEESTGRPLRKPSFIPGKHSETGSTNKQGQSLWIGSTNLVELKRVINHGGFRSPWGRRLLRAFSLGAIDEHFESLMEEQIRPYRIQEALGELPPFSLPPEIHDGILLGKDSHGTPVRMPVDWLNAGSLLAGSSGSGKSVLLTFVIPQIAAAGCTVWVSDLYKHQIRNLRPIFKDLGQELIVLRAQDWRVNLLQPDGIEPRIHLSMVVDLLTRVLELPSRSSYIIRQACQTLYDRFHVWRGQSEEYPCLFDLYEMIRKGKGIHTESKGAILDRMSALLSALTAKCAAYRKAWTPSDLSQYSIVFEFQGTSEYQKKVLMESMLFSLMQKEVAEGSVNKKLDHCVFFDDGQRLFGERSSWSGELTPMDELAGLIRGGGKGLEVSVQSMEGLSKRLTPNLSTKIMGRLGSHSDYLRLGADMGMNREQVSWAKKNLKPGVFIVQFSEGPWREPFVVEVPHVKVQSVVSEREAADSVRVLDAIVVQPASEYENWKPDHLLWAGEIRSENEKESHEHTPKETTISKECLDYLQSIAGDPFQNTSERDEALSLSAWKGNKIRKELTGEGWVKPLSINPGGRGQKFKLLEFSSKGRELLQTYGIKISQGRGRGGLEHQWWCNTIAGWLRKSGFKVQIEDESRGARVDIGVTGKGIRSIAIEVEMSKGSELENIRKDLEVGYSLVVSLVRDPNSVELLQSEDQVIVGLLTDYQIILRDLFVEIER